MSATVQITFDVRDPRTASLFWKEVLGYVHPAPPAQEKAAGQRTSSRMMMISSSVVRLMGRTTLRIMGSFHRGHPREGPTGISA